MMNLAIEVSQEPENNRRSKTNNLNNDIANTISAGKVLTDQHLDVTATYENTLRDNTKDTVLSEALGNTVNSSFEPTMIRPAYLLARDIAGAENTQEENTINVANGDKSSNEPDSLDKETKGYLQKTHDAADNFENTLAKIREQKNEAAKLEANGQPNDALIAQIRDSQHELKVDVVQYSNMMNLALDRVSDKSDTLDSSLVNSIYKDSANLNTKMDLKIIDSIKDGDLVMERRERELLGSSMDDNFRKLDDIDSRDHNQSLSADNKNNSPNPSM